MPARNNFDYSSRHASKTRYGYAPQRRCNVKGLGALKGSAEEGQREESKDERGKKMPNRPDYPI